MKRQPKLIAALVTTVVIVTLVIALYPRQETMEVIKKRAQIDGQISVDEYPNYYKNDAISMEIYWTIFENEIYFGLSVPAKGWVAIGWDPDGPMKEGADIVIGYVENDSVVLSDSFAYSATMHAPDLELGGKDDILEKAGSETSDRTVLEFKMGLSTGDNFDKPITEGFHKVLIGYSNTDNLSAYHGTNRAEININFFTGEIQG